MNPIINLKELLKGILVVISYLFMTAIMSIPFSFLLNLKVISDEWFYIGTYTSLMIFYCLIYREDLINDFKDFKKKWKHILKISFLLWLIGFGIMFLSSIIIERCNWGINVNQEENIRLLKEMPIVEIVCACLLAPITEELVFRRGLKKCSNNIYVYSFLSGLLFAFLHVISSITDSSSLLLLVYLVPYGALGAVFGYAYRKTDNIYGTIVMHSLHNALSIIQLVLIGCLL